MKEYINLLTGEIIYAPNRLKAYFKYLKCTPRKWVRWSKVVLLTEYCKNSDAVTRL